MIHNRLKMNDSKTEVIAFGTSRQLQKLSFDTVTVGHEQIKICDSAKYLGVNLDSSLKLEKQISTKCNYAFRQLHTIRKIRRYISLDACQTLIYALVTSHLDYANCIYFNLPKYLIAKMQRVQNAAVRVLFKQPKYCHVTSLRKQAHWLPIAYRIHYKILCLAYKAISDDGPEYLNNLIQFKINTGHVTRSSVSKDLLIPRTRTKAGERSFKFAAPTLWNKLSNDTRNSNNISQFKSKLKTELFRQAYN